MRAKGWGSLGKPWLAEGGAKVTLTTPPASRGPAPRCGLQHPRTRETGTGGARETAGEEEAQGPRGEGPPRSPGRRGSARQRGPEAAGQGAENKRCAVRSANYLCHVTRRRGQLTSACPRCARPGDSARGDVSVDVPPRPAPVALSAVLTAQARGCLSPKERRSLRPQGKTTPRV